jgi:hypothetical protein
MTPKQKKKKPVAYVPPSNPQKPHTAEWLYDEVMRFIEPDLMLGTIPTLLEKYKHETELQNRQRMEAYEISFDLFEEAYLRINMEFMQGAQTIKQKQREKLHSTERSEQKRSLAEIESQFDDTL